MTESSSQERSSSKENPLAREIGTPLLTIYGLGTILGAGIYVIIGEVAGAAGFLVPLAFLLAAAVAGLRSLANLTSAIVLALFATVNASLIVLKRRGQPDGVPDIPRWIPWCGALISGGAVVAQLLVDGVGG